VHAALLVYVGALLCASASATEPVVSDRWQVVTANGTKVGHARVTRSATDAGVVETERVEFLLGKSGRRVRYRMLLETRSAPDGSLQRLLREVDTREGHSRVEMVVAGEDLEVTLGSGKARTTRQLPGAARDLESDEFARAWLAIVGHGGQPAPLRYRTWDPVKLSVVDVELTTVAGDPEHGVERRVRSADGVSGSRLRADALGNVVGESMTLGTFELQRFDASEAAALAPNDSFDHIAPLLQPSPYRIPARDMREKIRYRFANHGAAVILPVGAGQRAWNEGEYSWMQVCASCPLDAAELPGEERGRALAPSPWLESADPKIQLRARNQVGSRDDAATKMRKLTTYVRGHMGTQVDMLGYGTALETLRSRRGDCTEYAVLLAALGRAAGVPTRIAIGRVYARHFEGHRHVFVPHAWVQAWTGTGWESFDAAIGSFDSTHLAFAVSYDGNPLTHYAGIRLSQQMTLDAAARVVPRKVATD